MSTINYGNGSNIGQGIGQGLSNAGKTIGNLATASSGPIGMAISAGTGFASQLGSAAGEQLGYALGNVTGYNQALARDSQNQYEAMGNIQNKLNMKLYDYQMQQTSPEMQVQRLEKAGLNPALMYGSGGASGSSGSMGSAGAGHAPSSMEIRQANIQAQQLGLQNAMMISQINLNESQAGKNIAEKNKISGVDTKLGETQVNLNNLYSDNQSMQNMITHETINEQIGTIKNNWQKTGAELISVISQANVDANTVQQRIDQYSANLANTMTDTALKESNIKMNNENIKLMESQIKKINNEVAQGWVSLDIAKSRLKNEMAIAILSNETGLSIAELKRKTDIEITDMNNKNAITREFIQGGFQVVGDLLDLIPTKAISTVINKVGGDYSKTTKTWKEKGAIYTRESGTNSSSSSGSSSSRK